MFGSTETLLAATMPPPPTSYMGLLRAHHPEIYRRLVCPMHEVDLAIERTLHALHLTPAGIALRRRHRHAPRKLAALLAHPWARPPCWALEGSR